MGTLASGCWDAHRSARPQVIERFTLEDLPAESGQDRGCGFGSSHWVSENQMSPEVSYKFDTGWWFGTWLLFFHILGMSSSQLTHIFERGRYTTNQDKSNQLNILKRDKSKPSPSQLRWGYEESMMRTHEKNLARKPLDWGHITSKHDNMSI